jgi:hypothetical protein
MILKITHEYSIQLKTLSVTFSQVINVINFKRNFKDKCVDNWPTERENLERKLNFKITYILYTPCKKFVLSRVVTSETGPQSPQRFSPLTALQVF